ncbi:hypothetical protein LZW34_09385 [Campylobacter coli]|nr:hypothetical protein [Campylobacter coli]
MASIEDSLREKELQKAKDILAFCELEDGEYPISKNCKSYQRESDFLG